MPPSRLSLGSAACTSYSTSAGPLFVWTAGGIVRPGGGCGALQSARACTTWKCPIGTCSSPRPDTSRPTSASPGVRFAISNTALRSFRSCKVRCARRHCGDRREGDELTLARIAHSGSSPRGGAGLTPPASPRPSAMAGGHRALGRARIATVVRPVGAVPYSHTLGSASAEVHLFEHSRPSWGIVVVSERV